MSGLNPRVRKQAQHVRKWAETNAAVLGSWSPNLTGLCGVATAELWRRLKRIKIDAQIGIASNSNEGHVFLIIDRTIIDVTATQFDLAYDPVEYRPLGHLIHPWYWKSREIFTSDVDLHEHQTKRQWTWWQRCNQFIIEGEGIAYTCGIR